MELCWQWVFCLPKHSGHVLHSCGLERVLVSFVDFEVLVIVVAFRQRLKSMAHVVKEAQ